jgi:hypothetical protein
MVGDLRKRRQRGPDDEASLEAACLAAAAGRRDRIVFPTTEGEAEMGEGFRKHIGPSVGVAQALRKAPHGSASRVLSHVPLFADLPSRDLRRVVAIAEEIWFGAGKVVAEGGSPGSSFFVILDGEARVVRSGSDRTIRRIGPGEYFGELALLDGGPRTATVIAETTLDTVRIRRAPFRELLKKEPNLGLRMMAGLASRIREYERQLVG